MLGTRSGAPATKSDLATWVNNFKIPVTSVIDSPPGVTKKTLDYFGIRETCVIVDVRTMKIVKVVKGSIFGVGDSSVKQLIPEILKLLGA